MPRVLVDVEDRVKLPAASRPGVRVPVDGDGETTLSIDKPGHPTRIELEHRPSGFLLIVRTGRIVTVHAAQPYEQGVTTTDEYRRIHGVSSI